MESLSERNFGAYRGVRTGIERAMTQQISLSMLVAPLKIRFRRYAKPKIEVGKFLKMILMGISEIIMFLVGIGITALLLLPPAYGQEAPPSKEQMKGLDEQVQEIKTDVLTIAADLNKLEEKLLYPSDTQIALFVSVAKGEKFRLDAVDIELDGQPAAHHLYTYKELEALQKGGVQRIHVGNVKIGEHAVHVTVFGKSEGGSDFRKEESFKVTKNIGPKLVGIELAGTGIGSKTIALKDW